MEHIVGIGGYAISNNGSDIIKTFALSTCVGMIFYSLRKRCMGMAHIQLPNSKSARAEDKPSRFADVAPSFLLKEMMTKYGMTKGEVLISLYGGIDGRGSTDCFRIGEKNLETVKAALKSLGLVYNEVDTGGHESRTLVTYVNTGVVEVIKRPMTMGNGAVTQRSANAAPSAGFGARPAAAAQGTRFGTRPAATQGTGFGTRPAATPSAGFGTRPVTTTPSAGASTRPAGRVLTGNGTPPPSGGSIVRKT